MNSFHVGNAVPIGSFYAEVPDDTFTYDPELRKELVSNPILKRIPSHADDPLCQKHVLEAVRGSVPGFSGGRRKRSGDAGAEAKVVKVTDDDLAHHSLVVGTTGSGKSRLAFHLARQQMAAGHSLVCLDPKWKSIRRLADCAEQAGLRPDQVVILDPTGKVVPGGGKSAPGWNVLDLGAGARNAAETMASIIAEATEWTDRMDEALTHGLVLLGSHGLSLYELEPLLTDREYRDGLCAALPPGEPQDWMAFRQAAKFFRSFGRGGGADATAGAVLNRLSPLLRSDFLASMFSARENGLDLASLWQEQRVVLVCLDEEALGKAGARLLGGLIAHQLRLASRRHAHPKKAVVLYLDEIGVSQKFVGSALSEIAFLARESRLRLVVACQYLNQMPPFLREALLTQCRVKALFRLGKDDAAEMAGWLAGTSGKAVLATRRDVTVSMRKNATVIGSCPLCWSDGTPLRLVCRGLVQPNYHHPHTWTNGRWGQIRDGERLEDFWVRNGFQFRRSWHTVPGFPPIPAGETDYTVSACLPWLEKHLEPHRPGLRLCFRQTSWATFGGAQVLTGDLRWLSEAPHAKFIGLEYEQEHNGRIGRHDDYLRWKDVLGHEVWSDLAIIFWFPSLSFTTREESVRVSPAAADWQGLLVGGLERQYAVLQVGTGQPQPVRVADVEMADVPDDAPPTAFAGASAAANLRSFREAMAAVMARDEEIERVAGRLKERDAPGPEAPESPSPAPEPPADDGSF